MAGIRFFNTPKPQRFEYKPRYYDEAKENLKDRLREANEEIDYSTDASKRRIAGSFRRKTNSFSAARGFRSKEVKRSNARLALIIVLLLVAGYLLLQSNFSAIEGFLKNTYGH